MFRRQRVRHAPGLGKPKARPQINGPNKNTKPALTQAR